MATYLANDKLRPCDGCGGALGATFIVRTERLAVVDAGRARQHLGLAMMFGGGPGAERVANAMGPGAVYQLSDEVTEEYLCEQCTEAAQPC